MSQPARRPWLRALVLALPLLALAACIELDGQRIAWFHDEARDELRILLFYDGIHDTRAGKQDGLLSLGTLPEGARQIREFVERGNVMLLDWFAVLDRGKLAKQLEGPGPAGLQAAERRVGAALLGLTVEFLGWYREFDGRLGAAQRVVIPQVSTLLADVNRMISDGVIADGDAGDWPRTHASWVAAARAGHTWLALEGQALLLRFPVHPDEWVRMKRVELAEMADDFLSESRVPQGGGAERSIQRIARSLSQLPCSVLDEGEQVTVILGRRSTPFLTRVLLRDEYESSMESSVRAAVPIALDEALAASLLQTGTGPDAALVDVATWGPPEERVRALVALACPTDVAAIGPQAPAAWRALDELAEAWNADGRLPPAPRREAGAPDAMPRNVHATWLEWYSECRGVPVTKR